MSAAFATDVVRRLTEAGFLAYWAGGCVRDSLRGETPKDYDVATTATPQQVREVFGPRRSLAVGESFGVMIVLGEKGSGETVEVATFRREGEYLDGRHPTAVEFCSAEEDAARRDFTINGMFYDPLARQVHDFVGGQTDLQQRIVRAIGDPRARMGEDKLRMLRAVRFAAALEFALDPKTATAIVEMAESVRLVSAERISQEFRRMLVHPQRARAMQLCEELGLLQVILPEVTEFTLHAEAGRWSRCLQVLAALPEPDFPLGMAALLLDVPSPQARPSRDTGIQGTVHRICRRLKLSNEETDRICWLTAHHGELAGLPGETLARFKRLAIHPGFQDLLTLERCTAMVHGRSAKPYEWIDGMLSQTPPEERNPPPLLTGKDLLRLGIPAGPDFKDWLTMVRDAQLNLEISTREEALELAKRLAAKRP